MTRCSWCGRHWLACAALTGRGRRGVERALSPSHGSAPRSTTAGWSGFRGMTPVIPGRRSSLSLSEGRVSHDGGSPAHHKN